MSTSTARPSEKASRPDECPFSEELLEMIVEKYHHAWLDGEATSIFPLLLTTRRLRDLTLKQLYKDVIIRKFPQLILFLTTPNPTTYLNLERVELLAMRDYDEDVHRHYLILLRYALDRVMAGRTHRNWDHLPGTGPRREFIRGVEIKSENARMGEAMAMLFEFTSLPMNVSYFSTSRPKDRVLAHRLELILRWEALYLEEGTTNYDEDVGDNGNEFDNLDQFPLTTAYVLVLHLWPMDVAERLLLRKSQWAARYLIRLASIARAKEVRIDCRNQHFFCVRGPRSELSDKLELVVCEPGVCPYRDKKQGHPHPLAVQIDEIFRGEVELPEPGDEEDEEDDDI